MVNQEIFWALKSAIARGQTLEQAMLTLFNTGYEKKEIQEAGRALQIEQYNQQVKSPQKTEPKRPKRIQPVQPQEIQQPSQTEQFQPVQQETQQPLQTSQQFSYEKTPQKVSSYEETYKRVMENKNKQNAEKGSKILVITLIIVLALLLGTLIALFIFKEQIIEIFS